MKLLPAVLLSLAVGCQREPLPDTAQVQRPAKKPTAAPAAKDVTIDLLVTANPVIVLGHARTFENAVTVRALAADKSVLAEQHVISTGEMGNANPYRAELWIPRLPGAEVTVEALAYSAKDGSVQASATKTARWEIPTTTIALVFPTKDCTEFGLFQREVPKGPAIARLMVEALVAGPTAEEKATEPFPGGSAVRSVILRN
ncbi:MAG: Gmad2 immunoglobulin-like domain-containing protein [Thermoanaerobaculia bacterium]